MTHETPSSEGGAADDLELFIQEFEQELQKTKKAVADDKKNTVAEKAKEHDKLGTQKYETYQRLEIARKAEEVFNQALADPDVLGKLSKDKVEKMRQLIGEIPALKKKIEEIQTQSETIFHDEVIATNTSVIFPQSTAN